MYTAAEYIRSLRDGRRVYINNEFLDEIPSSAEFRGTVNTVATLYSMLHDHRHRDVLLTPVMEGSSQQIHRAFCAAQSASDLGRLKAAIEVWARATYGFLGRPPDYVACFLSTLIPNAAFYGEFAENAKRIHSVAARHVEFYAHAFVDAPVAKDSAVALRPTSLRVVKICDSGLVVSGVKVVATNAAISNKVLVAHSSTTPTGQMAHLMFVVPPNADGLVIACRRAFATAAGLASDPAMYPLASRLDENDASLIFDQVLVPFESVLVWESAPSEKRQALRTHLLNALSFHGCTRYAVRLDFLLGLFVTALDLVGSLHSGDATACLGELLAWRNTFWGLSAAMAAQPDPGPSGTVLPNQQFGNAYRSLVHLANPAWRTALNRLLATAAIYTPNRPLDMPDDERQKVLLELCDVDPRNGRGDRRFRVMRLLWDALLTEFGGRWELFEENSSGGYFRTRRTGVDVAEVEGVLSGCTDMVERCLADLDHEQQRSVTPTGKGPL